MNNVAIILEQIRRTNSIIALLQERYGADSPTFALLAGPSRGTLLQLQQDLAEAGGPGNVDPINHPTAATRPSNDDHSRPARNNTCTIASAPGARQVSSTSNSGV